MGSFPETYNDPVLNCTFIFQCFTAFVEGLCCKPKYRAILIHLFIFVFFLYFSIAQQKKNSNILVTEPRCDMSVYLKAHFKSDN